MVTSECSTKEATNDLNKYYHLDKIRKCLIVHLWRNRKYMFDILSFIEGAEKKYFIDHSCTIYNQLLLDLCADVSPEYF